MDLVKKNIVSIICGVVALAAVAVAFTMVSARQQQLQADLDARKATHDTLADLLKKERTLPVVDPDKTEQQKLPKFPSEKVIQQGEAIAAKVVAESNAVRDEAVKMNQHQPLVPGSLPTPVPASNAYGFRNRYQAYFPGGATPGNASAGVVNPLASQFARDLKAGMPPTPDQVRIEGEKRAAAIRQDKLFLLPNGTPGNEPQVQAEITEVLARLPNELRAKAAQESKVYIGPATFTPHQPILAATSAPDPVDIYMAQLSLWMQQDVVAAVNETNGAAKNILDAPVKHLIRVIAVPNFVLPVGAQPTGDPDAELPKAPTVSVTQRVSNGLYDVFHFTVEADVEAARLGDFLRTLGKNRFITPLWVDVKSVDTAERLAQGLVYGEQPVLNVTVQCETLYMRKWNQPLMPDKIKAHFTITDQPAAPAADPAAAQPAAAAQ